MDHRSREDPMKAHRSPTTAPSGVADAVAALDAADGEGKILAGGQSLMPVLALRMARPAVLVDITTSPASPARAARRHVHRRPRPPPRPRRAGPAPAAAEAARWIGHTAIRTRGTVGGSLAHADPSAELPAVAVACDGAVHVAGPGRPATGRRRRPVRRRAPDRPGRRRDDHRGRAPRSRRLGLRRVRPPARRLRLVRPSTRFGDRSRVVSAGSPASRPSRRPTAPPTC